MRQSERSFSVADYHARGDGKTLDTHAVQAAIDACHQAGGGRVIFPGGTYLSGTIVLKDNVRLWLSEGATILGCAHTLGADYPALPTGAIFIGSNPLPQAYALIRAKDATNIGIAGPGTVDVNGDDSRRQWDGPMPRGIFLQNCRKIVLDGFTVKNSSQPHVHLAVCDDVLVRNLKVISGKMHANEDGLDVDSCRNVEIRDCHIDTRDDALCFKSNFDRACENVVVRGCDFRSMANAIKFGTASLGGFKNITITDCTVTAQRWSALAFQVVDGGVMEDVTVSDIVVRGATNLIFIRLGDRGMDFGIKGVELPRPVGKLRRVKISNVRAGSVWQTPIFIGGIPGFPVEDIALENIRVSTYGRGTAEDARRTDVPELEKSYPEVTHFGKLPAYGAFIRHARGVTLKNVTIELEKSDQRPALFQEDVQDLHLENLEAPPRGPAPADSIGSRTNVARPQQPQPARSN
jgi:hypothetical protein